MKEIQNLKSMFSSNVNDLVGLISILVTIFGVVAWGKKRANDKKRRKHLSKFLERLSDNLVSANDSIGEILNDKVLKHYKNEIEEGTFDRICPALDALKILSAKRMNGKLSIVVHSSVTHTKSTIENIITDVEAGKYDAFLHKY